MEGNSSSTELTYGKLQNIFVTKYGYACFRDGSAEFRIENHVRLFDYVETPQGRDYFTEEEIGQVLGKVTL